MKTAAAYTIGLSFTDPPRDEKFWTTHFNIRVSDWIGSSPLLRMKNIHHQIALFPTDHPGVQRGKAPLVVATDPVLHLDRMAFGVQAEALGGIHRQRAVGRQPL